MAKTTQLPNVFDYLDHRAFLAAWFDAKKKVNPRFSHRLFARLAGQKSPSLLLQVIQGKRNLTSITTEAFLAALKLRAADAEFFRALVDLDAATTDDERNAAWDRVSAQRRFRDARRLEGRGFAYLSHWYYPAIRELAARPDFRDDPVWVASQLSPPIKKRQARDALQALFDLGLLVHGDDGRVQQKDASIVTAPEVSDLAVCNFHREMATRAHDAVAAFSADERHLLGVTVAIPENLVPQIKDELNRVQARLLDLCDRAQDPAERVYQMNLQLVPLSVSPESP